jgi:cytochrome c oxidase cbb3-type subunit 1
MEVHGWLILVFGAICAVVVIRDLWGPEPPRSRLESYYDEPIKAGIIASMAWAVVAMFVGVWVAALLAFPDCPSSKHLAQIWRGGNGEQASSGVCF